MHFGQKKEQAGSIEQRLIALESLLPLMVRRIEHEQVCAIANNVGIDHAHTKGNLESVNEKAEKAKEAIVKLSEVFLKHVNDCEAINANQYQGIEVCHSDILQLQEVLKQFHKDLSAIEDINDHAEEKIKVLTDNCIGFMKSIEVLNKAIDSLSNEIKSLRSDVFAQGAQVTSNFKYIQNNETRMTVLSKEVRDIDLIVNNIATKFQNQISDLSKDFDEKLNQFQSKASKKLEELRNISIPDEREIMNKVVSLFDPVCMDAKNACLRSANTETKMLLMDKKIENIKLLLQRHELDK